MAEAVFVYADGQVGVVPLRTTPPVFRIPKPRRFIGLAGGGWSGHFEGDCEEFILQPRPMLDGRPIYCAQGFEVEEAYVSGYITKRADIEGEERAEHFRMLDRIAAERGRAIVLSERQDEVPLDENEVASGLDLQRMQMTKVCTRRIVALQKAS